MSTNRLFLFAGYDPHGKIDASLVSYVKMCAELGDVVVVMDCDADASQTRKLAPYAVHVCARRHGQYDFGSYRRAYEWAKNNLDLSKYDFMYLVNDSVYVTHQIAPAVIGMEQLDVSAFGMVKNPHKQHPHIQSWFIGLRPDVFMTPWFDEFMKSITTQPNKGMLIRMYEHGLTERVMNAGLDWGCLFTVPGRGVYNDVWKYTRRAMPMFKKCAFTRRGGALGAQIVRILKSADGNLRDAILQNARRVYGAENINGILTQNPLRIMWRNIKYFAHKIYTRGL